MNTIYVRTWLDRPASATPGDGCRGCLHAPDRQCAACGAPTAVILPADGHALTLCRACYRVAQACRAQATAEAAQRARQRAGMRRAAAARKTKKGAA